MKIPRRRARALLFYMVCTHTPQPRERLLSLLCGEMDEESARRSFKTLLAEVRAQLRSLDASIEWIVGDGDALTFHPLAPLWLDTEIFETALATPTRNLTQALKLYRGDFLDGFFLKDSPGFETWTRSTRDHFRHLYLSALRHMAEFYESEEQLAQAISCTQMLVEADPLSEEAHARLMRLYWQNGERIEALRQYEKLCAVLARELAVKPMDSIQALYRHIANDHPGAASSLLQGERAASPSACPPSPLSLRQSFIADTRLAPLTAPFVGRDDEIVWLRDRLTVPREPGRMTCTFILLQGEAGSGKTRLIEEVVKRHCSTWTVLKGTCQEIERTQPYHPILEALRGGLMQEELVVSDLAGAWVKELAGFLPDLLPLQPTPADVRSGEPAVLLDAVVALFQHLARPEHPLLLALDDLHWADPSTLALLEHLSRRIQDKPVFLLGTMCSALAGGRLAPLINSSRRQGNLAECVLRPLSRQDITALCQALPSAPARPATSADKEAIGAWCYQQSEGNPFLALEYLAYATKELAAGRSLPQTCILEAVEHFIHMQLGWISDDAALLLMAAAWLGPSFDPLSAVQVAGLDTREALLATRELLQKGFLVPAARPDCYTFAHRMVREVILASTSAMQPLFHHLINTSRAENRSRFHLLPGRTP